MWNPKPSFAEWRVNNLTMASPSRWRAERGPGTSRGNVTGAEQLRWHDHQFQDHALRIKKLEAIRSP
jgi:hypothetical protein